MIEQKAQEKQSLEKSIGQFCIQVQQQLLERLKGSKDKILVLSGPTACGKTDLAIKIAKLIGGEIISADSMQVYRGMDIGTAKIHVDGMQGIPHHLIDILHVKESFNVSEFYQQAHQCCRDILNRGKIPIVVGGTGFYLKTFLYGPPEGPPSVPEIREELEGEIEAAGIERLYQRLVLADPLYAASLTPRDKQKVVRALEIIMITGQPVSAFPWGSQRCPRLYNYYCWFIHRPREDLYHKIEERCQQMVDQGFLGEVTQLKEHGLLLNPSASVAIGYRQALEYLNSEQTEEDFTHFVTAFKQASRRYAKRQFTWFRKEKLFEWVDVEKIAEEKVIRMMTDPFVL